MVQSLWETIWQLIFVCFVFIELNEESSHSSAISLRDIYPNELKSLTRQKTRLLWIHKDHRNVSLFLLNLELLWRETLQRFLPYESIGIPLKICPTSSPGFLKSQQSLTMKTFSLRIKILYPKEAGRIIQHVLEEIVRVPLGLDFEGAWSRGLEHKTG